MALLCGKSFQGRFKAAEILTFKNRLHPTVIVMVRGFEVKKSTDTKISYRENRECEEHLAQMAEEEGRAGGREVRYQKIEM